MNRIVQIGLLFLGLFAVIGCGGKPPAPADTEHAREALLASLNAWQKGDKPETLLERSPPIQFIDTDWKDGWSLKSFKVADKDETHGLQRRCAVKLTLRGMKGKTAVKDVHYEIDTNPRIVIVRAFE